MVSLDAWSTSVEQLMCMDVLVKLTEIGNVVRQLDMSRAFCARTDAINFLFTCIYSCQHSKRVLVVNWHPQCALHIGADVHFSSECVYMMLINLNKFKT